MTLTYDARVFAVDRVHLGGETGAVERIAAESTVAGAVATTTFVIPSGRTKSNPLRIAVRRVDIYPGDAIEDPAATSVSIDGTLVETFAPSDLIPATIWGVEVLGLWADAEVPLAKGSGVYRYPLGARVTSVGPAPSPAGLELACIFDARAVGELDLESSTSNTAGSSAIKNESAEGITLFSLPALESGEVLDLRFAAQVRTPSEAFSAIEYSSINIGLPEPTDHVIVRATGRYSITDLTPSGNGQILDVAEGSI